jgi:hypothetical protein
MHWWQTIGMSIFTVSAMALGQQTSRPEKWKLTPDQEVEKARLEKYDKPLENDVTADILMGGAIKGAITGSAAKAAAAVASGAVTKGGAAAAKSKIKTYKKARKVKISKEADPPTTYTGSTNGGAQQ